MYFLVLEQVLFLFKLAIRVDTVRLLSLPFGKGSEGGGPGRGGQMTSCEDDPSLEFDWLQSCAEKLKK